jgi:DNA-binding CsgD family transcriptional regulator/tetratricopeptide (TPR) repeat protein
MGSYVGRADERARLHAALAEATARHRVGAADASPMVVLLSGEGGIGKTRLVAEVLSELADPQLLVARSAAFQTDDVVPLVPVAALTRDVARQLPSDEADDLVAPVRSTLARLLPELGPVEVGDESRPADVLPWLLTRLASTRAVLLVIDDVQWADASTLDFLARIPRQVRGALALLVVVRTDQVTSPNVSRALVDLARQPGAVEVELAPLDVVDSDDVVRSLGGDRLDAATRRQIVTRAEGNPLYLEALTVSALAGGDLPGRLVEALLAPVRALSQPARDLVHAAAVWGSPARPDELAELAGFDRAGPAPPWREARDAGVLVEIDDAIDVRHPLIRQAVLDDLTLAERAELQRDAVALLRRRLEDGSATPRDTAALAWLLESVGDSTEAAVAFVRAGESAAAVSYGESATLEGRALELWSEPAAAELSMTRLDLLERAAGHAAAAGDVPRAVAWAREARELWAASVDADPLVGSRLAHLHATCAEWEYDEADVIRAYEDAIALAEPRGASPELARALTALARHRLSLDENEVAASLAEQARAVADECGARDERALALAVVGGALAHLGRVDEARRALDEGLRALQPEMSDYERRTAWVVLRQVYLEWIAGDPVGAAATTLEFAHDLDGRHVASRYPALARANAAEFLVWAGEIDRANDVIAQVRREIAMGGIEWSIVHGSMLITECEIALRRGDYATADAILLESLTLWEARGLRPYDYHDLWRLAELRAMEGDIEAARGFIGEGLDNALLADTAEEVSGLVRSGVLVEGVAVRGGGRPDRERVTVLLDRASALESAGGCPPGGLPAAEIATARAEASLVAGQDDPRLWAAAVDAWSGASVPWWTSWCQVREAEALVAERGARAEASDLLDVATRTAARLGARPVLDLAADLARRAGLRVVDAPAIPRPRPSPESTPNEGDARWAVLTPREHEIVLMLAGGKSNRDIARSLFISEKTVSVHVSNVLAKWQVRSRLEVAAVVHRIGVPDRSA